MILALLWPTLAWIGGVLLIIIGLVNLIYWTKRARWEQCHGIVHSLKTTKHTDGEVWHTPVITGRHQSKPFKIHGNPCGQAPSVGAEIVVYHDPKTNRYFEYSRVHSAMNIFNPIAIGCVLLYVAWQSQNH